ncbi:MAG: hypothetical protein GF388_04070 [Candidatus Aegiribacteria sp.]|nr:hypothetical protein [Candidatus Aegiribacteria sp.]
MNLTLFLSAVLVLSTGSQLETSGEFLQAGRAYSEENDTAGESRILCRYLEESLYSGNSLHAFELIIQMESMPVYQQYFDFWYARLSWSCGLSRSAAAALDSVVGSPWLQHRAAGMAMQYRGDPGGAIDQYILSLHGAETHRQKFYSALDLCFALVQAGRSIEAEEISRFLAERFPGEGLPLIALALSLHEQDRFGQSMSALMSVGQSEQYSFICKEYARSLLEDLE